MREVDLNLIKRKH